jgi:hypothetical protein
MPIGLPELAIFVGIPVILYPVIRMLRRMGYPAVLGILALLPVANLALLWFVAIRPWPIEPDGGGHTAGVSVRRPD